MDTIFALATASGRAGVSVLRVSGPSVSAVCRGLMGSVPAARSAVLRKIRRSDQSLLDTCLVLYFEGPDSFTGEDVLELHLHGSVAVVNATLAELGTYDDCRMAEPGEFTRRALQNGKMDVTQVEGLADLIDAQTEVQRVQAQTVASGALTNLVDVLRASLIRAAALLEAVIDFADEDVPEDVTPEVQSLLEEALKVLNAELEGHLYSERIRAGFEVAIIGPPNAGKSTLLNALAGRDAAITSEYAGTTRDVIEVQMDLKGIPVTFLDTAGIRATDDPVEKIGVDRALDRAKSADLRLFLGDQQNEVSSVVQDGDIRRLSKGDLQGNQAGSVSGVTGHGVAELIAEIHDLLAVRVQRASLTTHQRHAEAFSKAVVSLDKASELVLVGPEMYDIAAEEIRSALRQLNLVIGRVDVENLLDVIFSSFCLGK